MRRGAFDYLPKPFTPDQLRHVLDRIQHMRRLQTHVDELEEQIRGVVPEADLQTDEPQMREALDVAFKTAATEATILIRGESGTGKGVLARAIHARSQRAGAPFVTVHCPSLSAELLESELFGHVQGGIHRRGPRHDRQGRRGRRRHALSRRNRRSAAGLAAQALAAACRSAATSAWARRRPVPANVRVLAATNRDLESEIAAGRFREDLFYRLNVIEVTVPPLRERPADILPLAEHLLRFFARQNGKHIAGFSEAVRQAICSYSWPGNIRELRNAVERAAILASDDFIAPGNLPAQVVRGERVRRPFRPTR